MKYFLPVEFEPILVAPLHTKLELMQKFVKDLNDNAPAIKYM